MLSLPDKLELVYSNLTIALLEMEVCGMQGHSEDGCQPIL
jgi:hypothetical protein